METERRLHSETSPSALGFSTLVASPAVSVAPKEAGHAPAARNVAMDAYRGFVMLLMMAEVLRLSQVARSFPGNRFWAFLAFNQSHVEWAGCSLHDMIQPSFSFLVGVALPYSIAGRLARGKSFGQLFGHALWRRVGDRKSTRLNSSHLGISYAVFCLKKKTKHIS